MHKPFSRRKFLQTAAVAGAVVSTPSLLRSVAESLTLNLPPAGLQLWSVRDALAKDVPGTLKGLAAMGYKQVEPFGLDGMDKLFGLPGSDFVKILKDNGMSMPSCHSIFKLADYNESQKMLSDNAKKAIDAAVSHGVKYIVNAWVEEKERKEFPSLVKVYNAAAAYAKKAGIHFAYHNHNFEFEQKGSDGRLLIEWMLHETDPALVSMEMDLYWVVSAHNNPLDWFKLYPHRWKLCHVKDMANTAKRESIEVGEGTIDFNAIFKQRALAGLEYFVIELEDYRTTSMEGVKLCRKNYQKLRGK